MSRARLMDHGHQAAMQRAGRLEPSQRAIGQRRRASRVTLMAALVIYALVLRLSYTAVIAPVWDYLGFVSAPIADPLVASLAIAAVVLPGLAIPLQANHASAILVLTYMLFLHIPLAVTAPLQRAAEGDQQGQLLVLLALSGAFVVAGSHLSHIPLLKIPGIRLKEGATYRIALGAAVLGTGMVVALSGSSLEISHLADVTDQRLAARELVAGSVIQQLGAYVMNWLAFGVIPFLLVHGLVRRRLPTIAFAIGTSLVCYAATAARSYLAALLFAALGYAWLRRGGRIDWRLVGVVSGVPILVTAAHWILTGPAPLLHWLLYRNYFTPASVTNDYLSFFSNHPVTNFSTFPVVRHFADSPYGELSVARIVAIARTGNENINQNGSFLSTGIENSGLLGVAIMAAMTLLVFYALDSLVRDVDRVMLASLAGHAITINNIGIHVAVISGGLLVSGVLLFLHRSEGARAQEV